MFQKRVKYASYACVGVALCLFIVLFITDHNRDAAILHSEVKGVISKVETEVTSHSRSGKPNPLPFTVSIRVMENGRQIMKEYHFHYPAIRAGDLSVGDSIYKPADANNCSHYKKQGDRFVFVERLEDVL